ncbi:MAG: signal peptidase I [Candidatus Wallbacteria bacterium]|nr:signal peptidase I [Candidatus Wallbacteria bacterium]
MGDFFEKLKISVGGDPYSFQQLANNNFIVGEGDVVFEAPGVEGFTMQQLYSGHAIVEIPLVQVKNRAAFRAGLLRGRNIFRVDPFGLEFSLYYKSAARDWVESILKAFVILLVIQTFVVQTFFIPTGSMKNTLFPGDYIMVEKLTFRVTNPDPGEIIVFEYPDDVSKDFIKRCIARGGDKLEVHGGVVTRNGRKMKEKYTVFKKRLLDTSWQGNQPEIGYDLRQLPAWPLAKGCSSSYVVSLNPRFERIPDLDVDSVEQADKVLKRLETAQQVDAERGSYCYDRKKLEVVVHPRGDISLAPAAKDFDVYFRFGHEDTEAMAEMERDLFGEVGQLEDRLIELPPDQLWAMGDNRNNSADSRFWRNPLRRRGLMGKGLLVYWPPSHVGMIHHLHFDRAQ